MTIKEVDAEINIKKICVEINIKVIWHKSTIKDITAVIKDIGAVIAHNYMNVNNHLAKRISNTSWGR